METYEAADYRNAYARAAELAGHNQLFPEYPSFAVPALETGDRGAGSGPTTTPYIPPVLLKAIAWIESGWAQASYDPFVPYGEVGPTLISHDCGYGLMQITSGMQNVSGVPNVDQAMIGGHYAFNIARGARILADKWNQAPEFRPVVGNRDPRIIENWYYAIWGYNGFSFKNHPLNPAYNPNRPPYSCGPEGDGLGHNRGQYPYQELVLGCLAFPPVRGGQHLWPPQTIHIPNPADPTFSGAFAVQNWEPCSFHVQCAAMDIPTPSPNHQDPTGVSLSRGQALGAPLITVSNTNVGLVAAPGGQSQNMNIIVANTGSGLLAWRIARNVPWLVVSRTQGVSLGSDLGGRNEVFTFRADASGLLPGTHHAQIHVESLYAGGSPGVINITLKSQDGALMQSPDGRVYVLVGGLKRYIPNPATFEAGGFSLSQVVAVPADWLNGVPSGHDVPNVLANGRILTSGGGRPVFVIDAGAKRHITSPDLFNACGYAWNSVSLVSDATINALPTGAPMVTGPCPHPQFHNGTLLAGSDGRVWVQQGVMRRWVNGAAAFADCGYRWGDVNHLGDGVHQNMPVGPNVNGCTSDGSLVSTGDGKVHLVSGRLMRHIPDVATFESLGLDWAQATPIQWIGFGSGAQLLSVTAPGRLIQPPGGQGPFFVMDGGVKRHIQSPEAFAACGYVLGAATTLSGGTLNAIPQGPSLTGPPCPQWRPPHASLLAGPDGTVWVTTGNVRKYVASPHAMADCGYAWGNLNRASSGLLASLPAAEPITRCTADNTVVLHEDGKVYLVRSGWKRHIPNPGTFEAMGLSWYGAAPVAGGWMPIGQALLDAVAHGRLVRPPGDQAPVYVIDGTTKRHITSPAAMAVCSYGWDAVSVVSGATLNQFGAGAPLTGQPCPRPNFGTGVLLAGTDGRVWVIKNGARHYINGPDAFTGCGYRWPDVNAVPDSLIAVISEGPNVSVGAC
jgi:hypothetical protein